MEKHSLTPEEMEQKASLEKTMKASQERLKLIGKQEKMIKKLNKLDEQRAKLAEEIEQLRAQLAEGNE